MTNYEKWDHEFRTNNLFAFNNNPEALLYLTMPKFTSHFFGYCY